MHGAEYTGMAALLRLIGRIDPTSCAARSPWCRCSTRPRSGAGRRSWCPADGKNLNRCFPGDPAGSYTDVLAHELFEAFIRPADVLLDLHAGDLPEALEPFCLYEESPVEDRARELALAYGTGHVVRQSRAARTVGGSTSAAAADIGVPAITAEIGANGICDEASVAGHLQGVHNVCAHLGMLPAEVAVPVAPPVEHDGWAWLRSPVQGFWQAFGGRGRPGAHRRRAGSGARPVGRRAAPGDAPRPTGCRCSSPPARRSLEDGLLLGLARS